jgi:hypothetical protein
VKPALFVNALVETMIVIQVGKSPHEEVSDYSVPPKGIQLPSQGRCNRSFKCLFQLYYLGL